MKPNQHFIFTIFNQSIRICKDYYMSFFISEHLSAQEPQARGLISRTKADKGSDMKNDM